MKKRSAFTIIELLAIIGIIIVLMGIFVPTIGKAMNKTNIASAKSMVAKLEIAVRNYYDAFGLYPPEMTYKYLGQKIYSSRQGVVIPVLVFEENLTQGSGESRYYVDPWGEEYLFYYDGKTPVTEFNLLKNNSLTSSFIYDSDKARITKPFIVWSKGPEINSSSDAVIGNWGHTRNKML